MHIGILQADSVRSEFQDRFGDYPDMFRTLLQVATRSETTEAGCCTSMELDFTTYQVQQNHYPATLDECDAYLITGSKDSVYDEHAWIGELGHFVRRLHKARSKLVGICFGHQLIAHYLGGETRLADSGWAVGVQTAKVIEARPWMLPAAQEFSLISSHRDQVTTLPDGATVVAGSDFCPVGSFVIGDHILTFQGHPEFSKAYSRTLLEMRREILGQPCYEQGCESLGTDTHAMLVAGWILNFLVSCNVSLTHSEPQSSSITNQAIR